MNYTGLINFLDVYHDNAPAVQIGTGYRIVYKSVRGWHDSMSLIDLNGNDLPEGPYYLMQKETRLVVINRTMQ